MKPSSNKNTTLIKNSYNYRIEYLTGRILDIKVDFISLQKALSLINQWMKTNKQYQITTPNPEHIIISQHDYRFKNIINKSALAIADGAGLIWAFKTLRPINLKTLNRLSGVDLMAGLCELAAKKNWRVFLLGGKNFTAANTAQNLTKNLKLKTISYYPGPQNVSNETPAQLNATINIINKFHPHILFVAFGAPKQEMWLAKNLPKLNCKIAMGVGGAFDYFAGSIKRAPKWLQNWGLEWLWRLACEPWRWRRQLRLLKFSYLVLKEKLS